MYYDHVEAEVFSDCSLHTRIAYIETSASDGYNVEKCINTLLDIVMKKMEASVESQLSNKNNNNHNQLQKIRERSVATQSAHNSGCGC